MATPVSVAAQLVSTAVSVLNAVRERVQSSKDPELHRLIGTLYDHFNNLNEAIRRVTQENDDLKKKLSATEHPPEKPEIRQVGAANFYFVGDKGPYCQPCYDDKTKLVALSPAEDWSGGIRRRCFVCNHYFYEKPQSHQSRSGTPQSFWST